MRLRPRNLRLVVDRSAKLRSMAVSLNEQNNSFNSTTVVVVVELHFEYRSDLTWTSALPASALSTPVSLNLKQTNQQTNVYKNYAVIRHEKSQNVRMSNYVFVQLFEKPEKYLFDILHG